MANGKEEHCKTKVIDKNLNPLWQEIISMPLVYYKSVEGAYMNL